MQRLGSAVGNAWGYISHNVILKSPDIAKPALITWSLSALCMTSSTLRNHGFSSIAKTDANPQKDHSSSLQADESCASLYFAGTAPVRDILGPIIVRDITGKGRALVTERELRPGDLVMAVQPVAILHGQQDSMPSPDALVEHLEVAWSTMPTHHRAFVRQMFVGPTATTTTTSSSKPTTQNQQQTPSEAEDDTGGVNFHSVVSYNAYGDEYEDLSAADLRGGGPPQSHVGLWPHFSNLNHACAPNCVHYVVGSTMVVRAVQGISEGSELLISYLGRDDLAPRQVRQAVLKSRYDFTCECARCRTEAELPEELQALLQQLYDRARHELAPRFERLATAAAAAAERLDGGGTPWYEDEGDDVPKDGVETGVVVGSAISNPTATNNSYSNRPSGTATSSIPLAGSGMTAAELVKRALRKKQEQQGGPAGGGEGGGAGGGFPWPGTQLASLEQRLEECARQLHLAVREFQEDDEASEGELASPTHSQIVEGDAGPAGRQLTRVQAAQAAAYQLLELLHLHAELTAATAAGGGAVGFRPRASAASNALLACWHVLDAIGRGSELQVFQACKLLNDALQASGYGGRGGKGGPGGQGGGRMQSQSHAQSQSPAPLQPPEEVREAAALLGQSLLARYGRLKGQQLSLMTQAAIRASRGFF